MASSRRRPDPCTVVYVETPWGRWSVLETGDNFKVKLLEVEPGQRFSYQTHQRREEYWVILQGLAQVTLGDRTSMLSRSATVAVGRTIPHRVKNAGLVLLLILETQFGDYLGEDDIVRLDDDYSR
jgi:mannose-6-phosphate isomerase-like protein (cupin superfamily)